MAAPTCCCTAMAAMSTLMTPGLYKKPRTLFVTAVLSLRSESSSDISKDLLLGSIWQHRDVSEAT
jgi:hypothetical protein